MKRRKSAIIFLIIILIIACIIIIVISRKIQKNDRIQAESDISTDFIKKMGFVKENDTYFSVEKMFNDYIENVNKKENKATYNLLDKSYIQENKITLNNIFNIIPNSSKYGTTAKILQMYGQTNMEEEVYYIECMLEEQHKDNRYYFEIYMDIINFDYSVKPIDKETFEKEINHTSESLQRKEIQKNENNQMINYFLEEKDIAKRYLSDFIENALYYPEYAYSTLDSEYKKLRFKTFEDFEKYINNNRERYLLFNQTLKTLDEFSREEEYKVYLENTPQFKLKGYQIRDNENYERYICVDNYNNYYIFYAKAPLNYTLMLDTYTIEPEDLTQKYETLSNQEKVMQNIQKITEALNGKDYSYIYSKLADSFKNNYFKTQEEFEEYAEDTFDIGNEAVFSKYTEKENLCTYTVKFVSKNDSITKTIIMRLEENNDFVMSFNVD